MTVKLLLEYVSDIDGDVIIYGVDELDHDIVVFQWAGVPQLTFIPEDLLRVSIEAFAIHDSNLEIFANYTVS